MQTKAKQQKKLSSASPYAQYGIPLGRVALRALERRGIYCQTSISVEHQHLAKRYVLRGVESGGAVSDMGRYCAFLNLDGTAVPSLQAIDSIAGNGRHAIIVAPGLVRIEMFRIGRTYELSITRHTLKTHDGRPKPLMDSTLLFRGRDGTCPEDIAAKNERLPWKQVTPTFFSESGEARQTPSCFAEAIRNITAAVNTVPCKRAQIATATQASFSNASYQGALRV